MPTEAGVKNGNVETKQHLSKNSPRCHFVKLSVNALKVLDSVILIGTGNYIEIYDRDEKKILNRTKVCDKTISGIESDGDRVLIYAENVVKLFKLSECCAKVFEVNSFVYNDWILAAKFMDEDNEVAFVSMHSNAVLLNEDFRKIKSVSSTETSTCYCAHIAYNVWDELYVLSGTAFSQILVWRPSVLVEGKSPIVYRVEGHKGVIFCIDFSPTLRKICSTSDDGRAIVWKFDNPEDQKRANLNSCVEIRKDTEFQHQQRVFRCRFFDKYLVTTAEDSSYRIYDVVANKLVKVANHDVDSIWSVDFCRRERIVFTGSTDGSVVATPIPDDTSSVVENKLLGKSKNVLLLSNDSAVYVTEDGKFIHVENLHDKSKSAQRVIQTHDDLKSYCVLEKTACRKKIALASYRGNVHIYSHEVDTIAYKISFEISNKPRIFSLHWLTCTTFMTCLDDGILAVWLLHDDTVRLAHLVELPHSDERWTTAASRCGPANFVVGDRRGSLYLYDFFGGHPVQAFRRIHPAGITKIYSAENAIVVLGRNSRICKYYFDRDKHRLSIITSDKLPFSWLTGYYNDSDTEIILGFSKDNFVIWDHTSRRIAHQIFCAGGHRSWDYHHDNNVFTFGYLRNETLHIETIQKNKIVKNIIDGFHGYETNTLRLIKLSDNHCLSVSGGEDTTLRLCSMDFHDDLNGFHCFETVKAHLSSVRVTAYCKISMRTEENKIDSYIVFSAGGRAQIIVWKLDVSYEGFEVKGVVIRQKFSYYKETNDAEIRVMDLAIVEVPDFLVLFAACSDGKTKMFRLDLRDTKYELIPVCDIFDKQRCVLKLFTIFIADSNILITASTDGFLTFFDITRLLRHIQFNENLDDKIKPLTSVRTNQSGINSCAYHNLSDNRTVILTGGDDKAFSLNLIDITKLGSSVKIDVVATLKNENFHFAHITGAYINDKYFVTASVDQKVMVYGWCLRNDEFEVTPLRLEWTCVCDVQGMDYLETRDDLKLVLYGQGVQVLSIPF